MKENRNTSEDKWKIQRMKLMRNGKEDEGK